MDYRDIGYNAQLMQRLYCSVGEEAQPRIRSIKEIIEEVYYSSDFLSVHRWEHLGRNNEEQLLYCQAVFRIRKDYLSLGLSKHDRNSMAKIPDCYVANEIYIKATLCFL